MRTLLNLAGALARLITGLALRLGVIGLAVWLWGERGRLLRPSTRALLGAIPADGKRRTARQWLQDGLHTYLYVRWPNVYIGYAIRLLFPTLSQERPGEAWNEVYHGKVLPTDLAKKLITVEQDIPRTELEQIIPYPAARTLVLSGSPDIAVLDCPCRSARENPCQPVQVCMIVGQPFVDFVLDHHPDASRRLSQAEAVELLEAEHARGHIHAAYFKDAMLDRFYAICNCCPCCCGGLEAMRERGVPMVISSGFVAQVDADRCTACGSCEDRCPFDAIRVDDVSQVDPALCMGCGVCESQCPEGAITLLRDESKPAPLDVGLLG